MDIHMSHMDHVVFVNNSYGFVVCSGARESVQLFNHRHKLGNYLLQEISGPFFQSLRKNRMISIGAGICNDLYSFFKLDAVKLQKTDQFRDHHAGMGVVDLNGGIVSQIMVIAAPGFTFLKDQLGACGNHEILLVDTQKTSVVVRIVRIQKQCQVLCDVFFVKGDAVSDNGFIYRIQIEKIQAVCPSLVAGNRKTVQAGGIFLPGKRYRENGISGFCRALGRQPEIGRFFLKAVFKILMEQAAVVTEADSVSRKVQRRQTVQETGCQTAETAVAEAGFRFQFLDIRKRFSRFCKCGAYLVVKSEIDQVVGEKFSDQELCGDIVKLSSSYLLFTGFAFFMRQLQKSLVDFFIGSRGKVFSKKACQCGIHGCTHVQDSFHFSE